jgi:triphosphoribosyl-dephospho-CoA synthase
MTGEAMRSLSLCAHIACILEVTARKPGNVHRFRDFDDATYLDFLLSAAASAPVFEQTCARGVGPTVLDGVQRTRQVTSTNTNLGILLLLAPLAAVPREIPLADGIPAVLERLTLADARAVFSAIRLARPGGLGAAAEQDVAAEPTLPLREVMALAANRDGIARQYDNGFRDVFQVGIPALLTPQHRDWPLETCIISCHLSLLAACPDTLIARKRGVEEAQEASRFAARVLELGWPNCPEGQRSLLEFDEWLRAVKHERNPGTTADLVTACLFAALREDTMQVPSSRSWCSTWNI